MEPIRRALGRVDSSKIGRRQPRSLSPAPGDTSTGGVVTSGELDAYLEADSIRSHNGHLDEIDPVPVDGALAREFRGFQR